MSNWRPRRVSEQNPVTRLSTQYGSAKPDVDSAWSTVDRCKSALRRAEQHLREADRKTAEEALLTGNAEHTVAVDRIPSYRLTEPAQSSSVIVDKFGRTPYLRAKEQRARKVSRLENKYREEEENDVTVPRQRSPLREPNSDLSAAHAVRPQRDRYPTSLASYSNNLHTNVNTSSAISAASNITSRLDSTDPKALSETERHFINDIPVTKEEYIAYRIDQHRSGVARKLAHVNVTVPSNVRTSSVLPSGGHTSTVTASTSGATTMTYPYTTAAISNQTSDSTFTVHNGGLNPSQRKLKKSLKEINPDSDALEKLREKIRQQRLKYISKGDEENVASVDPKEAELLQKPVHTEDDAVALHPETVDSSQLHLTRKVAAGPPGPTYRGFNEAETTYEGRMVRIVAPSDNKKKRRKARHVADSESGPQDSPQKKQQKPSRVIAPSKKPSKYDVQSDIITTRSWRMGQKAILRELGPNKLPTRSHSPPTKDTGPGSPEDGSNTKNDDAKPAVTAAVPLKALSDEAKGILDDLKSDGEDPNEEDHLDHDLESKPQKSSKRKRPKATEPTREEKLPKSRHYDSESVKQYIARQKADRRRRQQEQQDERRRASEKRQQQLAELQRKQHLTSRLKPESRKGVDSKDKVSQRQAPCEKPKPSGGSDKENRAAGDFSSSDGSSVGGGAAGAGFNNFSEHAGAAKSTREDEEVDSLVSRYAERHKDILPPEAAVAASAGVLTTDAAKNSGIPLSADDIISKYLSGQTADNIIEKYAKKAEAIKNAYVAPAEDAAPAARETARPKSSVLPSSERMSDNLESRHRPFSADPSMQDDYRKRLDRITAIRQTAESLQNRLQHETKRLTLEIDKVPTYTQPTDGNRWAYSRTEDNSDLNFMSRYDRLAHTHDDFNVFTGDLPGVGKLRDVTGKAERNIAASTIQAAYRGHSTRSHAHEASGELSDQGSALSDSTITEDGHVSYHKRSSKIGKNLEGYDFHAGGASSGNKPQQPFRSAFRNSAVVPAGSAVGSQVGSYLPPAKPTYTWQEPQPDPYSVLNVFARRSRQLEKVPKTYPQAFEEYASPREGAMASLGAKQASPSSSNHSLDVSDEAEYTNDFSQPSASHRSKSSRSKTPSSAQPTSRSQVTSRRSPPSTSHPRSHLADPASAASASARSSSHSTSRTGAKSTGRRSKSHATSHKSKSGYGGTSKQEISYDGTDDDGADTLNNTLTPSLPSDEEAEVPKSRSKADHSLAPSSRHKSHTGAEEEDGESVASISSLEEERPHDPLASMSRPAAGLQPAYPPSGRLSPTGLQRRMAAELNLLESMDESILQLSGVERARAIAMAQQETVSLAQILKGREFRMREESASAERHMEEARKRAADATQYAAQALHAARSGEAAFSLNKSTERLIATQTEAAHATAEAARQLAQAHLTAVTSTPQLPPVDARALAETAAAAATAAVTTALRQQTPYASQQLGVDFSKYESKRTQYSRRSETEASRTEASRTDVSRTDASFMTESADSSYTKTPDTRSRKQNKDSESSEVQTASDLSNVKTAASVASGSVATATDGSSPSKANASSVATESGAVTVASPRSRSDSIAEDILSDKEDYTIEFDTSVTEEEMEKSLRQVLPSEGLRKKMKRSGSTSDVASYSSDEHSRSEQFQFQSMKEIPPIPASFGGSGRRSSFEDDSFVKFSMKMVQQYMREEEIRAQHQEALLKLRERALKEKTRAELAWLEQQKQAMRHKGADDVYPQIRKRRRGLLLRLQQEQAEIKRLEEVSKAASKERQFLLLQSQEIARLRQSTQQVRRKMRVRAPRPRDLDLTTTTSASSLSSLSQVKEKLKRPPGGEAGSSTAAGMGAEIPTEDELGLHLDEEGTDLSRTPSPLKDGDASLECSRSASATDIAAKLKKMKLDENRHLTVREQRLRRRRKQVEELLAWKQKLDAEEADIKRMETEALEALAARDPTKVKDKVGKEKEVSFKDEAPKKVKGKEEKEKEPITPRTPRTPRQDTIAEESEMVSEIASEISYTDEPSPSTGTTVNLKTGSNGSISENIQTASGSIATGTSIPEAVSASQASTSIATDINTAGPTSKTSRTSIPTSIASRSKSALAKRNPENEDSVTTAQEEYYNNESFESDAPSQTATPATTPASAKQSPSKSPAKAPVKVQPKSTLRKDSEGDSDDSFSMTYSEPQSDASDVEGRIKALSEELKRRKLEAERLKREARKKNKEKLYAQEDSLKKQIEAYDSYIGKVQKELTNKEAEKSGHVKPKIKQPSESIQLNKNVTLHRSESGGSSGSGSGIEDVASPISPPADDSPLKHQSPLTDSYTSPVSVTGDNKTSTPVNQDSRPISPDKSSILQDKSEILEEVPEDVSQSMTITEGSGVQLVLDVIAPQEEDSEKSDAEKPVVVTPDAPKDDESKDVSYSISASVTAPKSSVAVSKKSQQDEIPESIKSEIPEESSIQTGRSATEHSELHLALEKSEKEELEKEPSKKDTKSEKPPLLSARSDTIASEISEDFESDSESSRSKSSDRSYSTESKTESRTYTDYSHSKTESRQKSQTKSRSPAVSREASVDTDEDISERLPSDDDKEDEEDNKVLDDAITELDRPVESQLSQEEQEDKLADFNLNDRVLVGGVQPGTLRFKGKTEFAGGYWGGVELDAAEGRNDGSVKGVRYFDCKPNCGLFAPPEKLSHLDEDLSQHTLTPDLSFSQKSEKDEQEGSVAGESIPEEVSLDQVISSAAAAVEEFSDIGSPADTPRGAPADEVVDRLTNDIFTNVIKDSVEAIGKIATKPDAKSTISDESDEEEAEEMKEDSSRQISQKSDDGKITSDKQRRLLEILASDDEDELEFISSSEEEEEMRKDKSNKDTREEEESEEEEEEKKDDINEANKNEDESKAVDLATKNLLNESISQMLDIYKRQRSPSPKDEKSELILEPSSPPPSPTPPAVTSTPVQRGEKSKMTDLSDLDDDIFKTRVITESQNFPDLIPSRSSFGGFPDDSGQDDLDKLYDELGALTGDSDEWFDDDFGLGLKQKAPPPPYPGSPNDKVGSQELRLDLQKVTQEPFFAVPHKKEEIESLAKNSVDLYWEKRRYGESWDDVEPPTSFFNSEDKGNDVESKSKHAFKQLTFDLTGDILRDIYQEEELQEQPQWMKTRRIRKKYFRGKTPPTTVSGIQPIVCDQVSNIVGVDRSQQKDTRTNKWACRKKRDHVDRVLLQELAEEEPDWVDYNEDEFTVKMQIVDSIFDSLLIETARVINDATTRKDS